MKAEEVVYQDEAFRAYRGMSAEGLCVHVYSHDGLTWVGTLPYDATVSHAKDVIQAYMRARSVGIDLGKRIAQMEMRKALGLLE